jgi:hypothetical protein
MPERIFDHPNREATFYLDGKRFTRLPYKTSDPREAKRLLANAGVFEIDAHGVRVEPEAAPEGEVVLNEAHGASAVDDFESMTRSELMAECKARDLRTKPAMGRAQLQAILRKSEQGEEPEE